MNAQKAIDIAAKFADRNESAATALADARATLAAGRAEDAANRACASLAHSVGVFSASYAAARDCLKETA